MPICIECRYPVSTLYTTYSKADDKALGKGVRLTQCPRCKRFADKYVEHDFVVLFIDLVLIKPQVYRHLLFNRLGREDERFDPSIVRLGILLLLFDVYLTWARIEKATPASPALPLSPPPPLPPFPSGDSGFSNSSMHGNQTLSNSESDNSILATQPILLQYLFFLALCTLETVSFHAPIRTLLSTKFPRPISALIPHYPHPALISTALLVSSFTKLFPLMLLVWNYDLPSSASAVSWAVIINNIAALEILLDCGYVRAALLAAVGAVCRAGIGWGILRAVGVGGGVAAAGVVETGDLIEVWRTLMETVGLG
ncbi:Protein arv1 [Pseudocercospora fuligena]|uniref:Protein ARV n=1 Tax=Pseudocercospora fuligena TaxID=685502 RepID=A0A8H6RW34_9PEZI|nr:Protein arv1 [Pseudocercospora fuligena]